MPFDEELYDGIFCYALIHLLNPAQRIKLINNCYNQLRSGGYMVFITISKNDERYGNSKEITKDTFKTQHGVTLFFYDPDSIVDEFGNYGLIETREISEPANNTGNKPSQQFWQVVCKK